MAITVVGSKQLSRKFADLGKVANGRLLEKAVVSGALLVQNEAKRKAAYLTGNLRRSIHIGGHEDLNPGGDVTDRNGAGIPQPEIGPHDAAVYVGTDVVYAKVIEFGYQSWPPRPYMRPAFDNEYKNAVNEMAEALVELLEKAI